MKRFPVFSETKQCQQLLGGVKNFLGDDLVSDAHDADMFLVGGGDGWMLQTMRTYHALNTPFFGLHCGTLGFLMNRCEDAVCDPAGPSLQEMNLGNIRNQDLDMIHVSCIQVDIQTKDGKIISGFAFNDITIGGTVLDYFRMQMHIDTTTTLLEGTGLVIGTALGSTAYAANLHTPLMPLESDLWSLSGIATGDFQYRFVSAQEIVIDIAGKSPALVGLDGYGHVIQDIAKITLRPGEHQATLSFLSSQHFATRRLLLAQEKLGR